MKNFKTLVCVLPILSLMFLLACGGSSSSEGTTVDGLPEIAVVDYSPLNPTPTTGPDVSGTPHATVKSISIDDASPVIGQSMSWVLLSTQHFAQNATQMLEGMIMEDSLGRSLLKTMAGTMSGEEGDTKTPVMGPHDVMSPTGETGEGYVGMDFSIFDGCASTGTYTTSVSADSPLSITAFVGPSGAELTTNPAFSLCITKLTDGETAGTVWLRPLRAQAMINGTVPTTTSAVMKTIWDDNYTGTDCPFTACRKFVSYLYDPNGELATILPAATQTPEALSGTIYISKSDPSVMYVNIRINFFQTSTATTTATDPHDLRCFIENGSAVNAFTNSTEVAGNFTNYYDNNVPTIANNGVVTTDDCSTNTGGGVTVAQLFQSILASFSAGACHTETVLVNTADCELAPLYTLSAEPSLDNIATDTVYPPNAPSVYEAP